MSHKIEAILQRARRYQLPLWQYQSSPLLNPYLLSSQGFVPSARNIIQCTICLKEVNISDEAQEKPEQLQQELKNVHDQNCIYHNEGPVKIEKEELYMAMEEIANQLNQRATAQKYPVLKSKAIWDYTQKDHYMLKKVMGLYQLEKDNLNISFFLKLFGWFFQKNIENQDCLSCYFCGRNLPVSDYKTTENHLQDASLQFQVPEDKLFDPIESHRYFCTWTGREENWLVFLQDLEDKYAEYVSFRLKVQPLTTKKMKVHIDKYLEAFTEKIDSSVSKLKQVGEEFNRVCQDILQDKNQQEQQNIEPSKKRLRAIDQELDNAAQVLKSSIQHPSKKVKTN